MTAEKRVTVDIDTYAPNWKTAAMRAYYGLQRWTDRVDVHVSSSGAGIHVIGYADDPETAEQIDEPTLRRTLGDDPNRLLMDRERAEHGHASGVLWDEKHGNDGSKQRDCEGIHDAIRRCRSELLGGWPDRMNRIVNSGHKAEPDGMRPVL